jgi:hypothetical protein
MALGALVFTLIAVALLFLPAFAHDGVNPRGAGRSESKTL